MKLRWPLIRDWPSAAPSPFAATGRRRPTRPAPPDGATVARRSRAAGGGSRSPGAVSGNARRSDCVQTQRRADQLTEHRCCADQSDRVQLMVPSVRRNAG